MASDFKSSFIPKEPVTEGVFKKNKTGFLGFISVALFVVVIILSGILYFYKSNLRNNISSLQSQLAEAEKSIDKDTINDLSRFADKLSAVKTIVMKHQAVSNILNSLASSTISTVYYTSFSYLDTEPNMLTFSLRGRALGYSSVALQEDIFLKNPNFKSVKFANLSLEEKGTVSFDVSITVDPKLASYSNFPTSNSTTTNGTIPSGPTGPSGMKQILETRKLN